MHTATIGALATFSLLMLAGDAFAKHDGNVCSADLASAARVDRGQFGVHNTSTSGPATVYCPIDSRASGEGTLLTATVYDRNSTSNVTCTFFGLNNQGVAVQQVAKSSTQPGTGAQRLDFNGVTPTFNMLAVCTIPAAEAGAFSHVTSFNWIAP